MAARKRPSYQSRRNELARAAGWKNYSEQRAANERGYGTAAEFRLARKGERALPATRRLRELVSLPGVMLSTHVRGYYLVEDRDDERALDALGRAVIRRAARSSVPRRVVIYNGDRIVGGRGGWGAPYLWDIIESSYDGSFAKFLADDYGVDSSTSRASGAVSVQVR